MIASFLLVSFIMTICDSTCSKTGDHSVQLQNKKKLTVLVNIRRVDRNADYIHQSLQFFPLYSWPKRESSLIKPTTYNSKPTCCTHLFIQLVNQLATVHSGRCGSAACSGADPCFDSLTAFAESPSQWNCTSAWCDAFWTSTTQRALQGGLSQPEAKIMSGNLIARGLTKWSLVLQVGSPSELFAWWKKWIEN